jgi:glycerophosphoryl diester phosphodiesterase
MSVPSVRRIERLHDYAGASLLRIAHRGARAYAPENTLAAFAKAGHMQCHMIELDVHACADGELVVHHDDDLLRCTDVQYRFPGRSSHFVSDFSAEQIASLDAGAWYVRQLALAPAQRQPFLRHLRDAEAAAFIDAREAETYASGEVRVPTLNAVLQFAESLPLLLNIEIKTIPRMYPGIAQRVVDSIKRHGMAGRVLVSSFDHAQLVKVRQLSAEIATGVLVSDRLSGVARYLEALDADAFHPGCYGDFDTLGFGSVSGELDTSLIDEVRAAGKAVNVWTCNHESQMRTLVSAGVTGIVTDYPNRLP